MGRLPDGRENLNGGRLGRYQPTGERYPFLYVGSSGTVVSEEPGKANAKAISEAHPEVFDNEEGLNHDAYQESQAGIWLVNGSVQCNQTCLAQGSRSGSW